MAVNATVVPQTPIFASLQSASPPSAQTSGASYIKGDPGPPGPQGPAGQDGQDGQDGFSPTVTPSSITGGHRLTIVDVDGTSTVDVMDGVDGQDGQDGSDGQDGFSPTITSTSITGGHRLTITDVDSTKTVDVMDGQDGQTGPAGQDGQDGTSAGFGTPSASVDSGTGTPGVTITTSGPDTAKVFSFAFTNLKGAAGQAGPAGQDGAMGPPGLEVSNSAPTSNVLAWIDTDEDTEILVPEMHTTATPNVLNMGTEYLDAAAVYDRTQGKTQAAINAENCIKTGTVTGTAGSYGIIYLPITENTAFLINAFDPSGSDAWIGRESSGSKRWFVSNPAWEGQTKTIEFCYISKS